MDPVDNIPFSTAYAGLRRVLLLLYDHPNPHPPLQLRRARQLTCLRPFHDLIDYHQHIANHRPEKIKLFANVDKILNWDVAYPALPEQLHKLTVYCQTLDEHRVMNDWNGRHQWKTKEIIDSQDLDFRLLLAAAELNRELTNQLDGAGGWRDILDADLRQIIELMGGYCGSREVQLSEEAT